MVDKRAFFGVCFIAMIFGIMAGMLIGVVHDREAAYVTLLDRVAELEYFNAQCISEMKALQLSEEQPLEIESTVSRDGQDTISELPEATLDLLARCVNAEAGVESFECRKAVAEVILNRVASDYFPNTVEDVIYQVDCGVVQFSVTANGRIDDEAPEKARMAVLSALWNPELPEDVLYFRAGYYHPGHEAYKRLGNTYFSLQ